MQPNVLLAIAIGGGLGSLARHYLSTAIYAFTGGTFPWGILTVNVIGGFTMGLIVELSALKLDLGPEWRAFFTTGILGGFTTFSAFGLETWQLLQSGRASAALLYALGSVVLGVAAVAAGIALARSAA